MITFQEVTLSHQTLAKLIHLSQDWEAEKSCYGYRANGRDDIEGNRIFTAEENGEIIGYLFGHRFKSENMRSIMPEGSDCFEVEELYVIPSRRSTGIGRKLFEVASDAVRSEAEYMVLSTATKNWQAIFHFYLDELGMEFWSARLFKRINSQADRNNGHIREEEKHAKS